MILLRNLVLSLLGLIVFIPTVPAYPLDGYESTGISRLEHQRRIQEGAVEGRKRPPGELLPLEKVDLRLLDQRDLTLPAPDAALTAAVKSMLGGYASRYGIALLDLSDKDHPRYAVWNGAQRQNPGSIGKILVALAIFQALADLYPDDIDARRQVLRESMIVADEFSVYDSHTVRFYDVDSDTLSRNPLQQGNTASMWTYLDWMMSPSSNSAAAMLQKHLMLLVHYGRDYPVSREEEARFMKDTPYKERTRIFLGAMQSPITRNGMKIDELRQGSFFTRGGKKRVGGTSSYATPRALIDYLLRMEKGLLVDEWSSRELKRLLYITERRIRYASSGALRDSAVYFKSGSLYGCEPEPGFKCRKYHGNKRNFMNSVAIVETRAGENRLFYMTAVLSNVLRKNSAADHRDLARAIHVRLLGNHSADKATSAAFGDGFIGYAEERAAITLAVDTQEVLVALGYDIGAVDGVSGSGTRGGIRAFQKKNGLAVDGKPTPSLLKKMREVAQSRGLVRPNAAN